MTTKTTEKFSDLYQRAAKRKGGIKALELLLGKKIIGKKLLNDQATQNSVATLSDDRILSAFTRQIFKSGFVWHP